MKSNKFLLVSLLLVGACDATAQKETTTDFKSVFSVISAKSALTTSFRDQIKKMQPMCTERAASDPEYDRNGNVKCAKEVGITALTMSGTETPAVTMIDATIAGTEKCAHMRSVLTQQYGKPSETQGSCDSKWVVKPGKGKPLIHIALEKDDKANVVYFANQAEQGP
jgi:hypothetical protein